MTGAAAWLASDAEAMQWIELERDSGESGPVVIVVQIRRAGVELLAAHGVEHAVLLGAAHRGLTGDKDAARLDRLQREHDALRVEVEERIAALGGLADGEVEAARAALLQRRQALAKSAQAVADAQAAKVRRVVEQVAKRGTAKSVQQHAAMVCAGVVQIGVVRPLGWQPADTDTDTDTDTDARGRVIVRPAGPVQLVTSRDDAEQQRGRFYLSDVFGQDEAFEISEAVYDHSMRGAGGRRVIETFHQDQGGRRNGGAAVGDERRPRPAGDRPGQAGSVSAHPDVHLPRDVAAAADPAGGRGEGVAGGGDLSKEG